MFWLLVFEMGVLELFLEFECAKYLNREADALLSCASTVNENVLCLCYYWKQSLTSRGLKGTQTTMIIRMLFEVLVLLNPRTHAMKRNLYGLLTVSTVEEVGWKYNFCDVNLLKTIVSQEWLTLYSSRETIRTPVLRTCRSTVRVTVGTKYFFFSF